MSAVRRHLEKKAKEAGIAQSVMKNLNNEELAAQIKDRTGKDPTASGNTNSGNNSKPEVIQPSTKTFGGNGAQVAVMVQPNPVHLLPTTSPFSSESNWYPVYIMACDFARWVQPFVLGTLLGVMASKSILALFGVA